MHPTQGVASPLGHDKRPRIILPRIIVCVQLASLAAMVAVSRADRRMLGDFNDLAMACSPPILMAYLFSLFVAPWIVIVSAWNRVSYELRVATIVLELVIVLALLYAAVPMVQ